MYIGIDNEGHPIGVGHADQIQLLVKDRLKNNIVPSDYINPSIKLDLLEMTIPEKPNCRNQRYRLTAKGVAYRNNIVKK